MAEMPPWFGKKRERQNQRSAAQERREARQRGGRVMPGSGASWRARGDVKTPDELVQVKYTDAASFTLKLKDWKRDVADAARAGRSHVMVVQFDSETPPLRIEVRPA